MPLDSLRPALDSLACILGKSAKQAGVTNTIVAGQFLLLFSSVFLLSLCGFVYLELRNP